MKNTSTNSKPKKRGGLEKMYNKNHLKRFFFLLLAFILLNLIITDHFRLSQLIISDLDKISGYAFYIIAFFALLLAQIVIISPVINSRIIFGFFWKRIEAIGI